jgi:hypothetical protein
MAKPVRSLAVSAQALIALREAELAVARAELALAQARASTTRTPEKRAGDPRTHAVSQAAARESTPAKARKAAPRAARKAHNAQARKFSGEIANPDAPATPRQLWALHLYTGTDTRGMTMTRAECSAAIAQAKAARKSAA